MKRLATVAALVAVFGVISAGVVVADQGAADGANGQTEARYQGGDDDRGGADAGQCDGNECEQDQDRERRRARECVDPENCGQDPALDPIQVREHNRIRECADPTMGCAHDPATDPQQWRERVRRAVWEHLGDGPTWDEAGVRQALWMVQHQYRFNVMV